ncbi:dienelactone hydrolase family protein [Undibacterium sp. Di27W]|uniref:dienelactone hydrolase family protein n=1 Tax=Undibacterium sp. Di27W TaxID=3413036 RepID=UPI003BEF614C
MTRLFLLFAFFHTASVFAAADSFSFSNQFGPHAVGVKLIQQYDRSRLYKTNVDLATGEASTGELSRPVQTLVWYPAVRGGTPLTYRQYLETIPTEDDFTRSAAEVKRMTDERIEGNTGMRRDALLRDVAQSMQAVRDAKPASGRFPIVIYAPGYSGSATENADLCEYLASQGYIVLSSASLGAHSPGIGIDQDGAETQAADISYLIGYASTLPQADQSKVAVIGFSWGGLSNVYAAAKDARIKALVSLDGSVRYFPQLVDGGKDAAKYVTPKQVAIPMLFMGAQPKTIETLNSKKNGTYYSFMNEMKYSDVYIITMLPMKHTNFTSFAMRLVPPQDFGDYTRDEISLAHSWTMLYTRHFLDAYLKDDAAGLKFINNTPIANKAPPHMIITDIRRKKDVAPVTQENFAQSLANKGFDKAIPVYSQLVTQDATFKLDSDQIYSWGLKLFQLNRLEQAREIFRLGTHLYPDQAFLQDGLAETLAKAGQIQEAIKSYQRVLELDSKNQDAIKYLKEHKAL